MAYQYNSYPQAQPPQQQAQALGYGGQQAYGYGAPTYGGMQAAPQASAYNQAYHNTASFLQRTNQMDALKSMQAAQQQVSMVSPYHQQLHQQVQHQQHIPPAAQALQQLQQPVSAQPPPAMVPYTGVPQVTRPASRARKAPAVTPLPSGKELNVVKQIMAQNERLIIKIMQCQVSFYPERSTHGHAAWVPVPTCFDANKTHGSRASPTQGTRN
jgi:hypothetical protein